MSCIPNDWLSYSVFGHCEDTRGIEDCGVRAGDNSIGRLDIGTIQNYGSRYRFEALNGLLSPEFDSLDECKEFIEGLFECGNLPENRRSYWIHACRDKLRGAPLPTVEQGEGR